MKRIGERSLSIDYKSKEKYPYRSPWKPTRTEVFHFFVCMFLFTSEQLLTALSNTKLFKKFLRQQVVHFSVFLQYDFKRFPYSTRFLTKFFFFQEEHVSVAVFEN